MLSDDAVQQFTSNLVRFAECMEKIDRKSITSLEDLNARQAQWVRDPFPGPEVSLYFETKPILKSNFLDLLDYDKVLSIFGNVDLSVSRLQEMGYLGGDAKEIKGDLGWISKTFTAVKRFGSLSDYCHFIASLYSNSPEHKDLHWMEQVDVFLKNDCVPPPGAPTYVIEFSDMEIDDDISNAVRATAFPGTTPELYLQCPVGCGNVVDFYKGLAVAGSPKSRKRKANTRVFYSSVNEVVDSKVDNTDKIRKKGYPVKVGL